MTAGSGAKVLAAWADPADAARAAAGGDVHRARAARRAPPRVGAERGRARGGGGERVGAGARRGGHGGRGRVGVGPGRPDRPAARRAVGGGPAGGRGRPAAPALTHPLPGGGPRRSAPHTEHARVDGNHRSTFTNLRPCRAALYASMPTNVDQPASCTLRASRVRARPETARSSTTISWFSRTIGGRQLVQPVPAGVRRPGHDTLRPCGSTWCRFALPFWRRASSCCARRSFSRRSSGRYADCRPSGRPTARRSGSGPGRCPPRDRRAGAAASGTSTTNEAWYRPDASTVTVTDDASLGRSRDQRTGTSPIPGRRSRPAWVILNRAALVNRIDWHRSRFATGTAARPAYGPSERPSPRRRSSGTRCSRPPTPAATPRRTPRPATPAPGSA